MHPLRLLPRLPILSIAFLATLIGPGFAGAEAAAPSTRVLVDDPAVMGEWGEVMPWPDKAVHSIMLHTGKVLWYRGESTNATFTWDPITNTIDSQPFFDNIFCSGQSVMPDGRVLVTSGRIGTAGSLGPKYSFIFDPMTETWTRGPDMRLGRYYATQLALGDGRTLVFSGYDDTHTVNEMVESFKPVELGGSGQWELLEGANRFMAYYPRFHLLSNGNAVHVGKDDNGAMLDPNANTWTPIATSNYGSRAEGTSVLLPPGYDKIMIMGGGSSTNTAEIIDFNDANPTWRYTAPMKYGRSHLNNCILPDGTVLVAGGKGQSTETVDPTSAVYPAEIFDPLTETWREVASMHTYRQYHSSALLLPDGRCMWAGTDGNHTAELYSPPYLFKGPRPTITSVPNLIDYGIPFVLQTNDASNIRSVVLMRPGATTHSQNMEQRYIPLQFVRDAGALDIESPTNPNIAPPGYYMLFILDGNKIPSVAKFVKLGGDPPPTMANRTPVVNAGADRSIRLPSTIDLVGLVSDDGVPNPIPTITWSKVSGPGTVTFGNENMAATTASFSEAGSYILRLAAFDGERTGSDVVTINVRVPCGADEFVENRLSAGSDDAEESASGSVVISGNDLELVMDANLQTVGLRFTGNDIPQGSVITNAWVQFMSQEIQSEATGLNIYGQDADSAATFTTATRNVSSRPRTDAFATWTPAAWTAANLADPAQRTPDLSQVIQEIVDRPGWQSRSLALIITGTGHRTAKSFETLATGAPLLHIDYVCGSTNRRPVVDAGLDQTITFNPVTTPRPTMSLSGRVTDDGLPVPPGRVSSTWRQFSGPVGVIFGDSLAPATAVSFPGPGTYELSLTGYDGRFYTTDMLTIRVRLICGGEGRFDRRVAVGADDAEENASGSVTLTGNDLELVMDASLQTVGLRYTGLEIASGAVITDAYVQFMSQELQSEATNLKIQAEDADTSAAFTTATRNLSARPKTDAFAAWTPAAWTTVGVEGAAQRTPDLTAVIQEIVDRPGWQGRSLALVITGTGHRTAKSFETLNTGAPLLHIEYGCAGTNRRPVADAGIDQSIIFDPANPARPRVNLAGRTTDDGLPNPPARLTSTWRQVGGPAGVTFGDSLAPVTTVTFPGAGTYDLSLTGHDGALSASDQVTITVRSCVGMVEKRVAVGTDDAEENSSGTVTVTGNDLELVMDANLQTVGLRFTGVDILPNAIITSAYVQFMSQELQSEATSLKIQGEDADTTATFTTATRNVSLRPRTDAFAMWAPGAWTTVGITGPEQRTSDLSAVIQEIVDRPGWKGRSLSVIITGTGHRTAKSFETLASGAALLHVEYGCGNRRPVVDAGPDQAITFEPMTAVGTSLESIGGVSLAMAPSANLAGRVTDDGLPNPPGRVTSVWRQVSGPLGMTFADSLSPATAATFPDRVEGTYVLSLTGNDGALSTTDLVTVTVSERRPTPTMLDRAITVGSDDAEESASGSVVLTGSDLEMMIDGTAQRAVGVRFTSLAIPPGANISGAWIQFKSKEAQSEATSLTIRAHAQDNAPTFTSTSTSISTRPMTSAASWPSLLAWTSGQSTAAQRTTDLKVVVQEIVSRPGWASGNAIAFVITGTGHRTAYAYESGAANAPVLHVEYFTGPVPNRAPVVNAGPDTTVMLNGAAYLRGTATDDGLPAPPSLARMWSKVAGPGGVTFDSPMAATTRATFAAEGSYRLELMAMDGAYTTRDSVDVTVLDPTRIPTVLEARILAGADDVEESAAGALSASSSDLEMMLDGTSPQRGVGVRFTNLTIPMGVSITNAWIQFKAKEAHTEATTLTVRAHAVDNAPAFATTSNVTSRTPTIAQTQWANIPAWVIGAATTAQRTTDLKSVVQEIVSRPGWMSGNAMAFMITGTGRRVASAFENGAANAPVLHVEYLNTPPPPPANRAPTVNAGPDTSVVLGTAAFLHGRANDDGMPGPLMTHWAMVGGPGTVTFDDAMAPVTRATFSTVGSYRLELMAMDGALEARDSMAVVVTATTTNRAPLVNAGPDTTVTMPGAAQLRGTASDDGLPAPPALITMWSKVSGPAAVTFDDPLNRMARATFGAAGLYRLELMAMDGEFESRDSMNVTVTDPSSLPTVLEARITTGNDDVEETPTGGMSFASSDLEMMIDGSAQKAVGLRFINLAIPTGVVVNSAWVQFKAKEAQSEATTLTVRGQAHDNAPAFASVIGNVSTRPMTTAASTWSSLPAWVVGTAYRTPELKDVVQEIVSRPGWATGNAMVIVMTGTGHRTASAFESGAASAALLHVEYVTAPPPPPPAVNQAPAVNAGPDTTIVFGGAAFLHGRASDDGLPGATLMTHWMVLGGPGTVTFDDLMAPMTRATFTAAGTYRLGLMAMDGALETTDSLTVVVTPQVVNQRPMVNAGPDTTVASPGIAQLRGVATDDGLPAPPALMTMWSKVGGPGTVTFDDVRAPRTRATFGAAGTYRLELMASDGVLEARDSVTVTVAAPPANQAPSAALVASPATGVAPFDMAADAGASSDADGDALSYRFDFGDGATAGPQVAPVALHQYAGGGSFTLTVIVTDGRGGADTASTVVTAYRNLVTNASFETALTGWNANGVGASIARVTGGHHGAFCVEARGDSLPANTFGVNDAPNWVSPVAGVGARYRFTAWVRSENHSGKAQIKVREYLNGVLQGTQYVSPLVTMTPTWQLLTLEVAATVTGSTLDFQVMNKPVVGREVFQVDDVAVVLLPAAAALGANVTELDVVKPPVAPVAQIPTSTRLAAVFPNPALGAATMRFELAHDTQVEIEVYDLRGALVNRVATGWRHAGTYSATWNGRDREGRPVARGLYLVRFNADHHRESRKLVMMK
jgi:hypothetical protein